MAISEALGKLGDTQAVEPLIHILNENEDDANVRKAVAHALGVLGDTRAIEPLITVLKRCDSTLGKEELLSPLQAIGEPAVPFIVEALIDEHAENRKAFVGLLQNMEWQPRTDRENALYYAAQGQYDKSATFGVVAIEPLRAILKEESVAYRKGVAQALGNISDSKAVELLSTLLYDSDTTVRVTAIESLEKIGSREAVASLNELFDDPETAHQPVVREAVVRALGSLGESSVVEPLIEILSTTKKSRMPIINQLVMSGDERAVLPLITLLKDKLDRNRVAAAHALGAIGDLRAVEPLITAIKEDRMSSVHLAAADALIKIGQPAVIPLEMVMDAPDIYAVTKEMAATILDAIEGNYEEGTNRNKVIRPEDTVMIRFGLNKFQRPKIYREHDFQVEVFEGQSVVKDLRTGLMWQQTGSSKSMDSETAQKYIQRLNQEQLAGFDDWRLPTMEELLSLLTSKKQPHGLYIDPIFDAHQQWCWAADSQQDSELPAWYVIFSAGCRGRSSKYSFNYVRAVRSWK